MTQPWAVIIAAVSAALVAGAFALLGHRIGLRNGRAQVTDQAAVEHEQWLRGQRQTAYLELLAGWDKLISDFARTAQEWDAARDAAEEAGEAPEPGGTGVESIEYVFTLTMPVHACLERVTLLGPPRCEEVAERMRQAMENVRFELLGSAPDIDPRTHRFETACEDPWGNLVRVRGEWFDVARDVMRTAPAPPPVVTGSWLRRRALDR
ncbi:hypothetical protein ABZ829_27680 [Streptomyces xanthochromogenes]|uniref:hypothetical protein n=1 Tax=Streptomyces xanthochromogenes TaxID=67384 RepID=UPI003448BBD9